MRGAQRWCSSLPRSLVAFAGDYAILVVAVAFGSWSLRSALLSRAPEAWLLAFAINGAAQIAIARAQRGLENLIHEGSHYNVTRHKRLNDFVVTALAAMPMGVSLAVFRMLHAIHHAQLGEPADGDRARNRRYRMDTLNRSSAATFFGQVARNLPRYTASWLREMGADRRIVLTSLAWHTTVVVTVALVFGVSPARAASGWLLYWAVPFACVLPVLRFIAEAAEHDYEGAVTVGQATISNVGWIHRWLIHPHGDGFHGVHHIFAAVPHHALRSTHEQLLVADPAGYGVYLRARTKVLQAAPRMNARWNA